MLLEWVSLSNVARSVHMCIAVGTHLGSIGNRVSPGSIFLCRVLNCCAFCTVKHGAVVFKRGRVATYCHRGQVTPYDSALSSHHCPRYSMSKIRKAK